ncbi:(Fe-S)-binding protein [Marinospirillum sp. MEB164]|uniref:(Fe-S)-binding protein n=1 Tax=Marinospirillum alkalitolerans TaxID=3123374 RepID=A0ABW8PWM4_9GAMM
MSDPVKIYPARPTKVYFYATCLVDLFFPDAGLAGVQLLEREGIQVLFPQNQTCCGQPAYSSGFNDQAREVILPQLDLFPEDYPIVVPSGSCAGMMRQHYPELFAGTPQAAQAEALAARTWELTDFLLQVCQIKLQDRGQPIKVAMHTSCSARREMGIAAVGPALLGQLAQVELVEQARPAECCGFGGTFALRHEEISGAMVKDKAEALVAAGAEQFVTTDCGCMMNIAGYAAKQKLPLQGQHIVSFLWERTQGEAS